MTRTAIGSIAVVAAAIWASVATAQVPMLCGERLKILANAAAKFSEVPVTRAIASTGVMVEVTASEAGTWTMILTDPESGLTCVFMSGKGWHRVPKPSDGA